MEDKFDWSDVDSELVQDDQRAVTVYPNTRGDVVIRQKGEAFMDEGDVAIIIAREKVERLISLLKECLAGG